MPRDLTRSTEYRVRTVRGEAVVVALTPEGIRLREPGRRTTYLLPYGVAFQRAVALAVPATRPRRARRVRLGRA